MAFERYLSWNGSPYTSNEYAKAAAGALSSALGAVGPFATALGGVGSSYMQGLGQQGDAYAKAYGSYAGGLADLGRSGSQTLGYLGQGLSQLGNSYAGAYGGYAGGLGEVAKAMAQEQTGRYSANAGAEAARQAALGSIGTAALGSYGQAANNAFGAWAANQQAYNQALQGLGTANQTGLAQLGSSRNAALGGLGGAYAGLGVSSAFGGGGGFSAAGPSGPIAYGSYGGPSAGSNAAAYAGLDGLQGNVMAGDISGSMNTNLRDSMNRLDSQHYSSREMPSQMLGQALSGLLTLGQDAYGNVGRGMREYYGAQADPRQRTDYTGILRQLGSGYRDASGNITGARGDLVRGFDTTMASMPRYADDMRTGFDAANKNIGSVTGSLKSGFGSASGALQGLFDSSLGNLEMFKTPLELAQQQRAVDLYNRRNVATDRIADMRGAPGGGWDPYIANWQKRLDNIPFA